MQFAITARRQDAEGRMLVNIEAEDRADAMIWFFDLTRRTSLRGWLVESVTLIPPVRYRAS